MSKVRDAAAAPPTGLSCQARSGSVSLGVQILTWASAASSRPVSSVMRRSDRQRERAMVGGVKRRNGADDGAEDEERGCASSGFLTGFHDKAPPKGGAS